MYTKSIEFDVLSPEEYESIGECEVTQGQPFSKKDGYIIEEGPCDLRLGSFDKYECKTCKRIRDCPGHFGFIRLAVPMFNINLIDRVKEILDILCLKCYRIKYTNAEREKILQIKKYTKDFNVVDYLKKIGLRARLKCPYEDCGRPCPSVTLVGQYFYINEDEDADRKQKKQLFASRVYPIFAKMIERDLEALSLNYHPSWLLFTIYPVLPNTERPTFDKFDQGHQRSIDKLTLKIGDIVQDNKKLKKEKDFEKRMNLELELQDKITFFFTSSYIKQSHTLAKNASSMGHNRGGIDEGKPLHERLKGKDGQLRGNLMGKRVEYSGRSVITGDPNLDLNQVGVPLEIARVLTVKERVWNGNISILQVLLDNTINSVISGKGLPQIAIKRLTTCEEVLPSGERVNEKTLDLRFCKKYYILRTGDTIERHLQKNDLIIFNRQPTLHRMSLMAMRVVVMPCKTFRMNVNATKPFNADIFFPKSKSATGNCLIGYINHQ